MTLITRLPHLAAALLAFAPVPAQAQASPLAGKWTIEYAGGMRIENETPTPIMAKALLTITVVGDSLVATLAMEPNPDLPPRPETRFAALKVAGNEVVFTQRSEARLNMNGEEQIATAISTWTLKAEGDAMSGTLGRRIDGMDLPMPPPQPVKGTRLQM
jgi:hypothetical protein